MLRLSASDVESFRYWKANEDSTLDELVARLTKKEPPTPQMEAGAAFAKLMEHATERSMHTEEVDGWSFHFELEQEIALPKIRELKGEMLIETPSGPVTLVGKVDGMNGREVFDQKLTARFDAERYLDSLQWRIYCAMFNAQRFVYDVFVGRYEGRHVTVTEYHPLTFYAYPNMREDVTKAVCELAEVIVAHGIDKGQIADTAKGAA